MGYDPDAVERYFDAIGFGEFERHDANPEQRIKFEIHVDCLRSHVPPGSRVLEIGPGPGRFTELLADMGCRVTAVEISAEQLRLHEVRARGREYDGSVERWLKADMCDLSALGEDRFDTIVAFGGPFSYVIDRRDQALRECLAHLAPGGPLLLSVMSKWGTIHAFLAGVIDISEEESEVVLRTGDVTAATSPSSVAGGHFFHMFTADELRDFLRSQDMSIEFMSASNAITTTWDDFIEGPDRFARALEYERKATRAPGAVDMGTHIIAVARGGTT